MRNCSTWQRHIRRDRRTFRSPPFRSTFGQYSLKAADQHTGYELPHRTVAQSKRSASTRGLWHELTTCKAPACSQCSQVQAYRSDRRGPLKSYPMLPTNGLRPLALRCPAPNSSSWSMGHVRRFNLLPRGFDRRAVGQALMQPQGEDEVRRVRLGL